MKATALALVLAPVLLATACVQPESKGSEAQLRGTHEGHHGIAMKPVQSLGKSDGRIHNASGRVVKVDFVTDMITITHWPIPSMNWPIMTMPFLARDKAMLDKVLPNRIVDFSFIQSGEDYVITEITQR